MRRFLSSTFISHPPGPNNITQFNSLKTTSKMTWQVFDLFVFPCPWKKVCVHVMWVCVKTGDPQNGGIPCGSPLKPR